MSTVAQQLPDAAVAFYQQGQKLSAVAVLEMRRLWRRMSLDDIDAAWGGIRSGTVTTLAALEVAAARGGGAYVADVLAEQGMDAPAVATVQPLAFARGSSGLPLTDVLDTVPAAVKRAIGDGFREQALDRGLGLLEGIAETQVADAARLATTAGFVSRPDVQVWTRVLNPPSCGRCALLAGRQYKWNASFQRHPRCDCRALPATVAANDGRLFDPRAYFDSLDAAGQDKHFGKGVAARIRSGDDIYKAVNASRDRYRVRLAGERKAARDAATGLTEITSPQTFMESLIAQVTDRNSAIRKLADAGYVAA